MGFSRQGYWSGLLCPPPGAPPDPGTEPGSLTQAGRCFTAEPPGKPRHPPGKLLFLPPHCLWEAPQGPRLKRHSAWLALPHTLPAFSHYLLHLGGSLDHASESRSVVSDSLRLHGLYSPWRFPGQNIGVGSLALLQEIFPTQGLNRGLPHCRRVIYQLGHKQDGRRGKITFRIKPHTSQKCLEGSNKTLCTAGDPTEKEPVLPLHV